MKSTPTYQHRSVPLHLLHEIRSGKERRMKTFDHEDERQHNNEHGTFENDDAQLILRQDQVPILISFLFNWVLVRHLI